MRNLSLSTESKSFRAAQKLVSRSIISLKVFDHTHTIYSEAKTYIFAQEFAKAPVHGSDTEHEHSFATKLVIEVRHRNLCQLKTTDSAWVFFSFDGDDTMWQRDHYYESDGSGLYDVLR